MDVRFVDDQGNETKRTMVTKCNNLNNSESSPLVSLQQETSKDDYSGSTHPQKKRDHLKTATVILMGMAGELVGTFILTLVIISVVSAAILSGAQVGIWQVGVVCGLGVTISIYCTAFVSDAHLNPAITLAFAVVRYKQFSWRKIPPYITAQMLGGILAGAVLYAVNSDGISLYEEENGIVRGHNSSILTAMMFGEYFPNPSLYDHSNPDNLKVTSLFKALALEAWSTSILSFVIFSLTNEENTAVGKGNKVLAPLVIGLTVSVMISIYGPYTQVGMNPARDLGPRLVAACAGWGTVAIPGPRSGFWVYVVGPVIGAVLGAALSELVITKCVKLVKEWRLSEGATVS